ncbi:uncharacterized protein LOC132193071 isoform X2 [Neocloeon triangulifer]|nr:uncharacterized protein LOC132193071 isoform X2 [Neocloeon triangulifer]
MDELNMEDESPVPMPRSPRPKPRAFPAFAPIAAPRKLSVPVPKPRSLPKPQSPSLESPVSEDSQNDEQDLSTHLATPLSPRSSGSVKSLEDDLSSSVQDEVQMRHSGIKRQVTQSLLVDFDPLLSQQIDSVDFGNGSLDDLAEEEDAQYGNPAETNDNPQTDINLEEVNEGYATVPELQPNHQTERQSEHIYDPVALDEPEVEEEPPEPPPRMDSIPREMWDNIPAARIGNSVETPLEMKAAVKRVSGINRAVRSFRNFMGESASRLTPPQMPSNALKRPSADRHIHEGRLTMCGREKVRCVAKISTKNISWFPDGGKKWMNWNLEHTVEVAAVKLQDKSGFEVLNCDGSSFNSIMFEAQSEDDRERWMSKMSQALTEETLIHHVASRIGWLYLKEGVGGTWSPSWLSLHGRRLRYLVPGQELQEIDLRKARCFEKDGDSEDGILSGESLFVVQLGNSSLYLQGIGPKATERWRLAIKSAIMKNGKSLREHQLTPNNVVVLVEMCTNFVITNGLSSEGIYRIAGQSSKVSALLEALQKDPYSVALTIADYNEHLVASALKRFFVALPEPILSTELMNTLAKTQTPEAMGHLIRHKLHKVAFATLRKVLSHLNLITREQSRNKMDAKNLATVWAVGLTHNTSANTTVLTTLVEDFPSVFEVDDLERQKETKVLRMLERLHSAPPQTVGAGDLRIWLTLGDASSTENVQVLLNPHKTAEDVVAEAAAHPTWRLQEVALGGALWRPLHPSELVMEVVARWGYWTDEDRAHNKLVLGPSTFYDELKPLAVPPAIACGQFKFATPELKAYKTRFLQLRQGVVSSAKIKGTSTVTVGEWPIKDMVWYQGYDSKRGPAGDRRWYLSLISKDGKKAVRSKERPFFGCTIAMERRQDMLEWCASLVLAEHPSGI